MPWTSWWMKSSIIYKNKVFSQSKCSFYQKNIWLNSNNLQNLGVYDLLGNSVTLSLDFWSLLRLCFMASTLMELLSHYCSYFFCRVDLLGSDFISFALEKHKDTVVYLSSTVQCSQIMLFHLFQSTLCFRNHSYEYH